MTVPELKSTVYLLPEVAWLITKQNVANTRRSLIIFTLLAKDREAWNTVTGKYECANTDRNGFPCRDPPTLRTLVGLGCFGMGLS